MKWMLPLLTALFIDLLTAGVSLALAGVVTGVSGLLQFIPFLGQIAGGVAWGGGVLLGIVINTCINLTVGSGLMLQLFMAYHGTFSRLKLRLEAIVLRRMLVFFFGELIPVVNNLPLMTIGTALTILHIRKEEARVRKQQEEEGSGSGAYTEEPEYGPAVAAAEEGPEYPRRAPARPAAASAAPEPVQERPRPARVLPNRFDDIRPPVAANDNMPRTRYAA